MLQPEFDRIGAGGDRELVHETLDREHVVIGAERAQRRNPQRHRRDEVMHHLRVGKLVERDRVAVAAAFRQRQRPWRRRRERLRHVLRRQHRSGAARPHRMGVAPDLVIPVGDRAVGVERGLQLRHHRRAERLPGVLLLAHPLHAHRARRAARARSARHRPRHRRRRCGRSSRSPRHGCSADAGRRHPQHFRDALAIGIDALRVRPHRHRAVDELRHGAGRPDRAVRLIGPRIGRLDGLLRRRPTDCCCSKIVVSCAGRLVSTFGRSSCFGRLRGLLPFRRRRQRVHRLDRLEFLRCDDGEEVAVAHDLDHAGQSSRPRRCRTSVSCAP